MGCSGTWYSVSVSPADAVSVPVMTPVWFQVLGFLEVFHSRFPFVPKDQLLGMLREV